jgi:pyruvate carboxylase
VSADSVCVANGYQKPPPRVMVCNRGEIARRVIRTSNHHGLETVAIYTKV